MIGLREEKTRQKFVQNAKVHIGTHHEKIIKQFDRKYLSLQKEKKRIFLVSNCIIC